MAFHRPLKSVEFDNRWGDTYLRPNNTDTVNLTINFLDDQGQISGFTGGLGYDLTTTLGTVTGPADSRFVEGRLPVTFTAGTETGTAVITAVVEGVIATTTLQIRNPSIAQLDLSATPSDLSNGTSAALVATVRDAWGDAVVGRTLRLSVSDDDGDQGTIGGSEIFTGTTDANGQVIAAFAKSANATGTVAVRAEAFVSNGTGFRVTHEDVEILTLAAAPPAGDSRVYLPLVTK